MKLYDEIVAMPDESLRAEYDVMRAQGQSESYDKHDRERFFMVLAEYAMRDVGAHVPEHVGKEPKPKPKPKAKTEPKAETKPEPKPEFKPTTFKGGDTTTTTGTGTTWAPSMPDKK